MNMEKSQTESASLADLSACLPVRSTQTGNARAGLAQAEDESRREELCSVCKSEPVWLEGLCQYFYEESVEAGFVEKPKEVIPKHSRGLKSNPDVHKERLIKKSIKIQRRK